MEGYRTRFGASVGLSTGMRNLVEQASQSYTVSAGKLKTLLGDLTNIQGGSMTAEFTQQFANETVRVLNWKLNESDVEWHQLVVVFWRIAADIVGREVWHTQIALNFELVRTIEWFLIGNQQTFTSERSWHGLTRSDFPKLVDGTLLHYDGMPRDPQKPRDKLLLAKKSIDAGSKWLKGIANLSYVAGDGPIIELVHRLRQRIDDVALDDDAQCELVDDVLALQRLVLDRHSQQDTVDGRFDGMAAIASSSGQSRKPRLFFEPFRDFIKSVDKKNRSHVLEDITKLLKLSTEEFGSFSAFDSFASDTKAVRNAAFHGVIYRDWPAKKLEPKLDANGSRLLRIVLAFDAVNAPLSHLKAAALPDNFDARQRDAELDENALISRYVERWLHEVTLDPTGSDAKKENVRVATVGMDTV